MRARIMRPSMLRALMAFEHRPACPDFSQSAVLAAHPYAVARPSPSRRTGVRYSG